MLGDIRDPGRFLGVAIRLIFVGQFEALHERQISRFEKACAIAKRFLGLYGLDETGFQESLSDCDGLSSGNEKKEKVEPPKSNFLVFFCSEKNAITERRFYC